MLTTYVRNKLLCLLKSFCVSGRGNVAITFAIAAIPLTTSVGAAVDYSFANWAKAKLNA
jgi:Flp pilus assembly protein TadG